MHRRSSNMTSAVVLAAAAALGACSTATVVGPGASGPRLEQVASFDHQVTGVTVAANGRIFVSFPRWTEDTEVSVGELVDGRVVPYPNGGWNAWRNARKDQTSAIDHWVCVQSVVADGANLWVIDPAAPAMGAVVKDGPKLVQIDLATNRVVRTFAFGEDVAPQGSYLNDVRLAPDGRAAYITDSGARGAIVVVDLASGKATRVLDGDPSTQPDKTVTVMYDGQPLRRPDGRGVEFSADGLALSVDGETLYWQAIKGKTLYSIPTRALRGADAAAQVKVVGENGPADGLIISRADGRMYVTSPQDDSIKVRDLKAPGSRASTLITDARLRWPDTFGEGPDGSLYVTTSRIQDSAFFKAGAPAALPTALWRFRP
jgi:sugar lactone lactonase YvrE